MRFSLCRDGYTGGVSRCWNRQVGSIDEVDHFIFHQANIRILQTAVKRMKIPWEKTIVNIERYGNMSAACIPLAVAEAVNDGIIRPGQLLLMVGFGAGMTMGSALVRWGR